MSLHLLRILLSAYLISQVVILSNGQIKKPKDQTIKDKPTSISQKDFDLLPDGTTFRFWEDKTNYRKVLHVAQKSAAASDDNPGTLEKPFKTINAAARILQPGEKVIVHEGVYRECVRPARGGTAVDRMIAYEAAQGENVIIKGSEIWKPELKPSIGWRLSTSADIMMADIPEELFKAYNPFSLRNAYHYLTVYGQPNDPEWMQKAMLFRGGVYINGVPLKQAYKINDLFSAENAFWVEDPGTRLHIRLSKEVDLSIDIVEITAREQIFAPKEYGLGYIKVSGFVMEHAADGLPVPQRAAMSTMRGHHWIIENNTINQVNACALDIGLQSWDAMIQQESGFHIIRQNTIRNAGICGIAGAMGVEHTLIENNLIEKIGLLNLERMYECAAIKFHHAKNSLIRQNTIRQIHHASGIWLDCGHINCRVTNNVFSDILTLTGGLYMEMNFDQNLVDHNVFWDIKSEPAPAGWDPPYAHGAAIRVDCNDHLIVAHNFFGKVQNYAVSLNLVQSARKQEGRTGIGFANKVINNIFYDCPNRVYLARQFETIIDGNLYDKRNQNYSFVLLYPEPYSIQNLKGWQYFFGIDKKSTEADIDADFNDETGVLKIKSEGDLPQNYILQEIMNGRITSINKGPFLNYPSSGYPKNLLLEQKFPIVIK